MENNDNIVVQRKNDLLKKEKNKATKYS